MKNLFKTILLALLFGGLIVSCSPENDLEENEVLIDKKKVVTPGDRP